MLAGSGRSPDVFCRRQVGRCSLIVLRSLLRGPLQKLRFLRLRSWASDDVDIRRWQRQGLR
eukprot:13993155-Alexandrium_andersonii.AAC.1